MTYKLSTLSRSPATLPAENPTGPGFAPLGQTPCTQRARYNIPGLALRSLWWCRSRGSPLASCSHRRWEGSGQSLQTWSKPARVKPCETVRWKGCPQEDRRSSVFEAAIVLPCATMCYHVLPIATSLPKRPVPNTPAAPSSSSIATARGREFQPGPPVPARRPPPLPGPPGECPTSSRATGMRFCEWPPPAESPGTCRELRCSLVKMISSRLANPIPTRLNTHQTTPKWIDLVTSTKPRSCREIQHLGHGISCVLQSPGSVSTRCMPLVVHLLCCHSNA